MPVPVRYPSGVTTVKATSPLRNYPGPDPRRLHQYWDDFDQYVAADWVITDVGTDTRAVSAGADGGILVLTTGAIEDDGTFLQWSGNTLATTAETWKFASGFKLWFMARFKVSDATQSDFIMGLQITDTTPLAVSDGVYWRKDDGDANLDFVVMAASTATTATAASTCVDDTYMELGFYYDGASGIEYYKDGIKLGTAVTTNMPSEELTVSFGVQAGAAAAKTLSLDYILCAKERTVV